MKASRFIALTLTIGLLAGCQQAAPEADTMTEEDTGGKLLVDQVMPDGSSERVMEIDLDNTKPVDVSILENTKGMVLDQDGFSPDELSVKVGTKLIIEARGEEGHQPMGDHEGENICEDLDSEKELTAGQSYEYTFNEVGTCTIHDHSNQDATATIEVVAA